MLENALELSRLYKSLLDPDEKGFYEKQLGKQGYLAIKRTNGDFLLDIPCANHQLGFVHDDSQIRALEAVVAIEAKEIDYQIKLHRHLTDEKLDFYSLLALYNPIKESCPEGIISTVEEKLKRESQRMDKVQFLYMHSFLHHDDYFTQRQRDRLLVRASHDPTRLSAVADVAYFVGDKIFAHEATNMLYDATTNPDHLGAIALWLKQKYNLPKTAQRFQDKERRIREKNPSIGTIFLQALSRGLRRITFS